MPKTGREFWENLAQMYHSVQNPAAPPVQQTAPTQPGAPPPAPQHFEEGGMAYESNYPTGDNQSTSTPRPESPWGLDMAKGFLGQVGPAAGKAATAMLIDKMFPGTPARTRLLDTRQPEQQQASQMALGNLTNLQKNPNSFGLPGDPNDVNSPAGQRMYQIKKNVRSASAAAGGLETGGGAQRETDAVNKAIGDSYQQAQNSGFQNVNASSPPLHPQSRWDQLPGVENPWASVLTKALTPGVGDTVKKGTDQAFKNWFV